MRSSSAMRSLLHVALAPVVALRVVLELAVRALDDPGGNAAVPLVHCGIPQLLSKGFRHGSLISVRSWSLWISGSRAQGASAGSRHRCGVGCAPVGRAS